MVSKKQKKLWLTQDIVGFFAFTQVRGTALDMTTCVLIGPASTPFIFLLVSQIPFIFFLFDKLYFFGRGRWVKLGGFDLSLLSLASFYILESSNEL